MLRLGEINVYDCRLINSSFALYASYSYSNYKKYCCHFGDFQHFVFIIERGKIK